MSIDSHDMTAATAYWNQRKALAAGRPRIEQLIRIVDSPTILAPRQWTQLMAFALEFQPDLILELGRLGGNSTCAFTESAHRMSGGTTRVVSLCRSPHWARDTMPRLLPAVGPTWFDPLTAKRCDIVTYDYAELFQDIARPLVFWDAHGFAIAESVLGRILPLIAHLPHAVIMHDLSDARYSSGQQDDYAGLGLWKGVSAGDQRYRLGHIDTAVAQALSAVDFTTRNHIPLRSADQELHESFMGNDDQGHEMTTLLGSDLFSLQADWFWFTLNDASGPYTFPRADAPTHSSLRSRVRAAALVLLGR